MSPSMVPYILILLWHSAGGYGIETAAISQQRYDSKAACMAAGADVMATHRDHITAWCEAAL